MKIKVFDFKRPFPLEPIFGIVRRLPKIPSRRLPLGLARWVYVQLTGEPVRDTDRATTAKATHFITVETPVTRPGRGSRVRDCTAIAAIGRDGQARRNRSIGCGRISRPVDRKIGCSFPTWAYSSGESPRLSSGIVQIHGYFTTRAEMASGHLAVGISGGEGTNKPGSGTGAFPAFRPPLRQM